MDAELRDYLKGEFEQINRQFDEVRREIRQVETRLDTKIDGVETRLGTRIDGVETRLDARIDGLDAKSDKLDAKINNLDAKSDGLDAKIDGVETRLSDEIHKTRVLLEDARGEIRLVAEGVANNGERIDRLTKESHRERQAIRDELLGHLRTTHQTLDRRVTRLEDKENPSGVSFPRRPRPGRGL